MVIGKTALLVTTLGLVFVAAAVTIYAVHPDFIFGNPLFQGPEGRSSQDKTPSGVPSTDTSGMMDKSQESQLSPPNPPAPDKVSPPSPSVPGVSPPRRSPTTGGSGGGGSSGGDSGGVIYTGVPVVSPIPVQFGNQTKLLVFMINATDPDGKSLTYSANNVPANASFHTGTREFSWVPLTTQHGFYIVNFSVSNGVHIVYLDVKIYVYNIGNQAPVWTITPEQEVNETEMITFQVSAIDPDGDPITYSVTNIPANATFDASTQIFTWTPVLGQAGDYYMNFTASDGILSTDMEVEIEVESGEGPTPVPEFPVPGVPVAILAAGALIISLIRIKKPGQ